ncbi:FAD-dependent oxidoreductase [Synechocystis sp. LKSZ1]|uniref:FAD-dependent oxidoreductase n=1 Tax=Synechocystis sp. LKSZ1 TaxID=3144951 RepID=UPI00336C11F8
MRIVLVGGGHSHALVLHYWSQRPLPGVELVLISNVHQAPYSGMVPGYLAGLYRHGEIHIDLPSLAEGAQARFVLDTAIAVDPDNQRLHTPNQGWLDFDLLSLDLGSTPYLGPLAGAEWVLPAKPVPQFLEAWQDFLVKTRSPLVKTVTLAIVGGGAGGVELALNLQARLRYLFDQRPISPRLQIHLLHQGEHLLPGHSRQARRWVSQMLRQRGIQVSLGKTVKAVEKDFSQGFPMAPLTTYAVIDQTGHQIAANLVLWVTQASAPDWLRPSGLTLDDRGFIQVGPTLQSLSHSFIFASGDIASLTPHPCPKAGVFAVRQGRPLFENLRRYCLHQPLKPYIPQKRYLSLLGTGQQTALASWGPWAWHSALAWRWKDWLDRRFMAKFAQYHH